MLLRYVRNIMYTAAIYREHGTGCACLVARQPLSWLPPGPPELDQGIGQASNVKKSLARARVLLAQEIQMICRTAR